MDKNSTLDKKEQWIEDKLKDYESDQKNRMESNNGRSKQWYRPKEAGFYASQVENTTILIGGLTEVHDYLIEAALKGLGYKAKCLSKTNNDSFRLGKEYCNRGLCNPTYYTVGNLLRQLIHLRDNQGLSSEEIVQNYIFVTAGSCGPCRFGMYEAEYRKALNDAGFEGFRVLTFQQSVSLDEEEEELGLKTDLKFYIYLIKALLIGDIINTLGYRIRPYEINSGETDKVIQESKEVFYRILVEKKSIISGLLKIKKKFSKIKIDPLEVKPVVDLIGEFWAMTTESDGNYNIQRWLENEGAEVKTQKIFNWLQYIIYENELFFTNRIHLKEHDEKGLKENENPKKTLRLIRLGKKIAHFYYYLYTWLGGLKGDKLPDMKKLDNYARQYYHPNISGGEGHLEVGKLIKASKEKEAHMVLSVKPFGCMPSAGVSDGVQSKIQELYQDVVFYPIETTGDNESNIYSRVQMMLFKAKKNAKTELDQTLTELGITLDEAKKRFSKNKKFQNALYRSPHIKTSTASNVIYDLMK